MKATCTITDSKGQQTSIELPWNNGAGNKALQVAEVLRERGYWVPNEPFPSNQIDATATLTSPDGQRVVTVAARKR